MQLKIKLTLRVQPTNNFDPTNSLQLREKKAKFPNSLINFHIITQYKMPFARIYNLKNNLQLSL